MYSEEIINDVRFSNDIVDVISQHTTLKQSGNSFKGLCPFHKESTPSFSVSQDKQLYHCFGCGASGNIFNFMMNIENMDFMDALIYLAERVNYTLPENSIVSNNTDFEKKQKLFEIHKLVARKFYDNLTSNDTSSLQEVITANKYLENRKLSREIRIKYGIGYSILKNNDIYNFLKLRGYDDDIIVQSGLVIKAKNGNMFDRFSGRIMFPIIDIKNKVIAFGGRDITNQTKLGKYINSPDTPIFTKSNNLYSINFAKNNKRKELILVEGYMDVIALYQAGIHNTVASLGTSFNENHIRLLKKFANKVILLFDTDDAGKSATLRTIPILENNHISTKICTLNNAKDPDEYIKKFGVENFVDCLNASKSSTLFDIEHKLKNYNIGEPAQKIEFTKLVAKIIAKLESPVERDVFTKEVSHITKISVETIKDEINMISNSTNPIQKSKLIRANKTKTLSSSKLDDARNGILYVLASDLYIFNILRNHIKPENFIDDFYIKFAEIIFESNSKNLKLSPAEVTLMFENEEYQKLASKIFMPKIDLIDNPNLETAINSQLKIIKRAYYDKLSAESSDDDFIRSVFEEKKQFEKVYINI